VKILLVQPYYRPDYHTQYLWLNEPLALEYVGAGVRDRHHVAMVDMRFDRDLDGWLDRERPDVVAITGYTIDAPAMHDILARVKRWRPETITVVGGHHATVIPEDFLDGTTDYIVLGEGVHTFAELIEAIDSGGDVTAIPGLAIPRGDHVARTGPRAYTDLDALPFPHRELNRPWRDRYFSAYLKPLASLRTSIGCPSRCNFCSLWRMTEGRYLRRTPEAIVEELTELDYAKYIFFVDDESLADARRMEHLAELILERGIRKKYFMYGRAKTIAAFPRLIPLWRRAGLDMILIGMESFRDTELADMNKRTTAATNEEAIRICREHRVNVNGQFIINPNYTKRDFRDLAKYIHRVKVSHPTYSVLTPLPGTDLYDEERGRITVTDYNLFDLLHAVTPTTLPLKAFYKELSKLYFRTPSPLQTWRNLHDWPKGERLATVKMVAGLFWGVRSFHKDHVSDAGHLRLVESHKDGPTVESDDRHLLPEKGAPLHFTLTH
jgi:radical SAM superfamily enzyme YgiQ (UPF0313 family)